MSDIKADQEIDCRGMNCPLPILKTKKAVEQLTSGQILKMTATDPGSANDMDAWARRTGNEIVASEEANGEYTYYVKRK